MHVPLKHNQQLTTYNNNFDKLFSTFPCNLYNVIFWIKNHFVPPYSSIKITIIWTQTQIVRVESLESDHYAITAGYEQFLIQLWSSTNLMKLLATESWDFRNLVRELFTFLVVAEPSQAVSKKNCLNNLSHYSDCYMLMDRPAANNRSPYLSPFMHYWC